MLPLQGIEVEAVADVPCSNAGDVVLLDLLRLRFGERTLRLNVGRFSDIGRILALGGCVRRSAESKHRGEKAYQEECSKSSKSILNPGRKGREHGHLPQARAILPPNGKKSSWQN